MLCIFIMQTDIIRHFTLLSHLWSLLFSFLLSAAPSFLHPLFSSLSLPSPSITPPFPPPFFSLLSLSLSALILLALFFLGLLPLFPLKGYESVSINPEDFEDKVVLILGRGLSLLIIFSVQIHNKFPHNTRYPQ